MCLAANSLKIKPLIELACAKIATEVKGEDIKEIRKYFNIENDSTFEE